MTSRWITSLLIILGAVVAVAVVVLLVGGGSDKLSLTPGEPEVASADQLSEIAGEADAPLYWLGERPNAEYEVTQTSGGRFYIRYLKNGAKAGDERPAFVAVGTYPARSATSDLRKASRNIKGAELARADDGALLLVDPSSAKSVHLVYPGEDSQIEVYSPIPGQALRIAKRGEVQPIP